MSASQCPEDLLILERRGTLGPDEQRALAEHAATCELCSLSRALGRDLARDPLPALAGEATGGEAGEGAELGVDGHEQTRLALIVARTMLMRGKVVRAGSAAPDEVALVPLPARRAAASRATRRRRARSPRRFAAAAALLLLAGSASAALWRWSAWTIERARIKERAADAEAHRPRPHRHAGSAGLVVPAQDMPAPTEQPSAVGEPLEPVAQSEQPVAPPPPAPIRAMPPPPARSRIAAAPARPPVPELDARQLFVAAGQARRARNFAQAEGLYRALQAHFPGSPEATLSFLSLGDLSLSQGALAQALAQFDAYLASGDTTMAEEALVGRARTLARLGRTEEERAAWRALLSRFPQSDYRWRAQQCLDGARAGEP